MTVLQYDCLIVIFSNDSMECEAVVVSLYHAYENVVYDKPYPNS